MKRTLVVMITFVVALAAWSNTPAQAAEITILVNQGALSGVRDLAAGYEKATGHKVVIDFVGVRSRRRRSKPMRRVTWWSTSCPHLTRSSRPAR